MKNKYLDFRKEIVEQVVALYNLFPEDIRDILETLNEVTSDFNNFMKIIKIFNKFKERFLVRKIERFLKNTSSLSLKEMNDMIQKCETTKEKFTEQLIIIIDRLESDEKIDYFSKLFILFVQGNIEKRVYFRCCKILENYSYYDISSFSKKDKYYISEAEDILALSMGLLQNIPQKKGEGISMLKMNELVESEAGKVFLKLKNRGNNYGI